MKKKSIVCGVLASSVALAATFGGCSLVSTNTGADMNQVIATVNIANTSALDKELENYKSVVGETSIIKRELVAYFINYGYSYVQNYGYSYEKTFNTLLDALVENAILVQYSTMYLLNEKATNKTADGYDENALATYKSKGSDKEKYEYLLGGENSEDVNIAKYNLYYTINSAIDAREKEKLKIKDSSNGTDTRTAPDGVDTQKENYYPQKSETDKSLNYNIYTGYEGYTLDDSGAYEKDKLEGTNNATRIAAYNDFLKNLKSSSYNLVDIKKENLRDVLSLNYIEYEYINQLQQRIINKYYDVYEEKQEAILKQTADNYVVDGVTVNNENDYGYIDAEYKNLLNSQKESYKTESNFTSAMDNLSDSSFVLYSPNTDDTDNGGRFGFVYNILLPFSNSQNDELKALQSLYADKDLDSGYKPEYYVARNELLKNIETTDQRSAWFNGEKEYAFNAKETVKKYFGTDDNTQHSDWLFFENNVSSSDKYEALEKYAGLYPYNGTVVEKKDDYLLIPNTLTIDGANGKQSMLDEFVNYIDYVMGTPKGTTKYDKTQINNYGKNLADNLYSDKQINGKDVIDYSNFIYTTGKVNFGENNTEAYNRANLLDKTSAQYKALSAVNELQYAYTTDTGVLSHHLGYSVQADDTSYIKEFEYAAHLAIAGDSDKGIQGGAGSYAVCAGDYGWHLIYVTYTFDAGKDQYEPKWAENINTEGTFENLFYEWYKSKNLSNISTERRDSIITNLKVDETVTKYESTYKNLFELDKNN